MSKSKNWELLFSEKGDDLTIFKARFDHLRNPRNGATIRATVLESNHSANVVAITKTNQIILVKQYRFGIGEYTLELPGGFVDDNENHALAVRRELAEETGYSSQNWEYLGKVQANPVFMDSYIHQYVARDVEKTEPTKQDVGEDVTVVEMDKQEVINQLRSGEIAHPHTITALVKVLQVW